MASIVNSTLRLKDPDGFSKINRKMATLIEVISVSVHFFVLWLIEYIKTKKCSVWMEQFHADAAGTRRISVH